jgi:hypothetical protein
VLLALASGDHGFAAEVLTSLDVRRDNVLSTSCIQPPPRALRASACISVMPRLKQALEHTRRIADGLGAPVADTEHLLAGIAAVPDSMASRSCAD